MHFCRRAGKEEEPFTVYIKGLVISGYVTFWRTKKAYWYQCDGLGDMIRCKKEMYDEARALYAKQLRRE